MITVTWNEGNRIVDPAEFSDLFETTTGHRLWPRVSTHLNDCSSNAQMRFVRIIRAYTRAVWSEASELKTLESHLLSALSTHLKRRKYREALDLLVSMFGPKDEVAKLVNRKLGGRPARTLMQRSVVAERRVLVLLNHALRREGDLSDSPLNTLQCRLAHMMNAPTSQPPIEIQWAIAATGQLTNCHNQLRKGKVGRGEKYAQKKLLKCLAIFWRQNSKYPVLLRGAFSGPFLDYLDTVNDGLRNELSKIKSKYPTWYALHPPDSLPFSAGRKATIAALKKSLNSAQRDLLDRNRPTR